MFDRFSEFTERYSEKNKQKLIENSEYMIELDNVTKFYKPEIVAVSGATVKIPRGSVVGFLGPNGSGKSTILKMLVGEINPSLGKVRVYGQNPWNNPHLQQYLGYISEIEAFYEWMTPNKFLYWMGKCSLPREEAKKKVIDVLNTVDMTEHSEKPIGTFSKGMRQRIRVALALLKPKLKLMIADEPLSGLDPRSRNDMFHLFKHLHDLGVDIFVSSHILFEIERITKHIVLIYNGQIIALGKTGEIRNLLTEYPYRLKIVTDDARKMLQVILDSSIDIIGVEELNISTTLHQQSFVVSTKRPSILYDTLPDLCIKNDLTLYNLVNMEENIETEAIFKYLVNP